MQRSWRRMASTFIHEAVTGVGRVGTLAFGESSVIPTPNFLLHTTGGSVPHLTPDVVSRVFSTAKPLLLVSLDTCLTFVESLTAFGVSEGHQGHGIAAFSGLSGFPVFLSPHNPLRPLKQGFNHGDSIALWSRNGRRSLELKEFKGIIPSFKPAFVQALSDYDVDGSTSGKRLKKSTSRTLTYLEGLTTPPLSGSGLFATLELGWFLANEEEASKTVTALLNDKRHLIQGVTISGAAFPPKVKGPKTQEQVGKEVVKLVESVDYNTVQKMTSLLPFNLPIYIPGPFSPAQMVGLVSKGVDLFDSSWVTGSADLGLLLNMDQVLAKFPQSKVKVNANNEALCTGPSSADDQTSLPNPSIISIKDKRYFKDFTPISSSCSCVTCRKHSRAYVNHLYATDELLGPVLVMIHNLTALTTLMETIRNLLKIEAEATPGGAATGDRSGIKDLEILQEILSL